MSAFGGGFTGARSSWQFGSPAGQTAGGGRRNPFAPQAGGGAAAGPGQPAQARGPSQMPTRPNAGLSVYAPSVSRAPAPTGTAGANQSSVRQPPYQAAAQAIPPRPQGSPYGAPSQLLADVPRQPPSPLPARQDYGTPLAAELRPNSLRRPGDGNPMGGSKFYNDRGEPFMGTISFAPGTPDEYREQAYKRYAEAKGYFQQDYSTTPQGQQKMEREQTIQDWVQNMGVGRDEAELRYDQGRRRTQQQAADRWRGEWETDLERRHREAQEQQRRLREEAYARDRNNPSLAPGYALPDGNRSPVQGQAASGRVTPDRLSQAAPQSAYASPPSNPYAPPDIPLPSVGRATVVGNPNFGQAGEGGYGVIGRYRNPSTGEVITTPHSGWAPKDPTRWIREVS